MTDLCLEGKVISAVTRAVDYRGFVLDAQPVSLPRTDYIVEMPQGSVSFGMEASPPIFIGDTVRISYPEVYTTGTFRKHTMDTGIDDILSGNVCPSRVDLMREGVVAYTLYIRRI